MEEGVGKLTEQWVAVNGGETEQCSWTVARVCEPPFQVAARRERFTRLSSETSVGSCRTSTVPGRVQLLLAAYVWHDGYGSLCVGVEGEVCTCVLTL